MNLIVFVLVSAVFQIAYSDDAAVSDPLRNPPPSGWSSAPPPGWSSAPPPSGWSQAPATGWSSAPPPSGWSQAPYPGWANPGWGVQPPPVSNGTTEAQASTILINQVAGSNVITNPQIVQVNASEPGANISMEAHAEPDLTMYVVNGWYDYGGTLSTGQLGGQYFFADIGESSSDSNQTASGVQTGALASNFSATGAFSMNQAAFSVYGQVSNGTNVADGGGSGGWSSGGWGNSPYPLYPQDGNTSSLAQVIVATGLSQLSTVSDDQYAAISNSNGTGWSGNSTAGNNTVNYNSTSIFNNDQTFYFDNYDATMAGDTTGIQYFAVDSHSDLAAAVGVVGANDVAVETHPSIVSNWATGGVVMSTFLEVNNGTNFNSGGWGAGVGTGWKNPEE